MSPRIYLDNAATTPLDPGVLEAMMPYLNNHFGNPSSIYSYGRETRLAIEKARKTVAAILHAHPAEIFFTSGGTESTNTALFGAVNDLGCTRIITSAIEHHATLHTCAYLAQKNGIPLEFVRLLPDGHIDMLDLEDKLGNTKQKTLVTLMHANNEIGNITDLQQVSACCKEHGAIFHADTVQTVGHYPLNLSELEIDFITASAHKFHGPKGAGVLYINSRNKIPAFIHGGGQERNMRAGTENIYGIVGLATALELASGSYDKDSAYIGGLKAYMINCLQENISGVVFNGDTAGQSLYAVLSVGFPKTPRSEMLLFNLDINNICVSGGSACSSGTDQGSHVIKALNAADQATIRFSFNKYNTKEEIDQVVAVLKNLI